MAVKHRWNTVPSNWERLSQPPADTTIDLYVALKPHNENALIDALYEVSDPKHLSTAVLSQIWRTPVQGTGH